MRNDRHTRTLAILSAVAILAGACTSAPDTPSFGARLLTEGGDIARIGEKWSEGAETAARGQAMIEDGAEDIERGEDLIAKGRKKKSRGEDLVRKGERMKRAAEETYRAREVGTASAGS